MIDLVTFEHEGPCCESCLREFEDGRGLDLHFADECCCRGIETTTTTETENP